MQVMQKVQVDIPYEKYLEIIRHPDCHGYRGRNEFCKVLMYGVESLAFKSKQFEHRVRQVERERDQARRELERKVKNEEFLKTVQSGELFRSVSSQQKETKTGPPIPMSQTGRTASIDPASL